MKFKLTIITVFLMASYALMAALCYSVLICTQHTDLAMDSGFSARIIIEGAAICLLATLTTIMAFQAGKGGQHEIA